MAGPALMSISAVPSLIMLTNKCYFLSKKHKKLKQTKKKESEEELKSLLMKVKEKSEKVSLKLSIQKTKIMESSPITSWQIVVLQNHC